MKRNKLFARVLALALSTGLILAVYSPSFATEPEESQLTSIDFDSITSEYVLLYEATSNTVLYEKKGFEQAYPASTTKIMTAIIVIENCELDEEVKLGNVVETNGSTLGLRPGEKLTVRDLLYGMMLVSGNDAARALAEHMSGSIQQFANTYMKEYIERLGLEHTNFVNPHGMDKEAHYSTPYDMARLTAYAMENETFRTIVSTEMYHIPATNKDSNGYELENTNRLIHKKDTDANSYVYSYATGVKTGDTRNAGRCLIAAAEKEGMKLIAVLFGDYSTTQEGNFPRFVYARQLFEYGFDEFKIISGNEFELVNTTVANVSNAVINQVALDIDLSDCYVCVSSSEMSEFIENAPLFSMRMNFENNVLSAPFSIGDIVGTVDYLYRNEVVLTANLVAKQTVEVAGSGNANTGVRIEDDGETVPDDNSWVFWIGLASIIIMLIIVINLITRRKPTQLRKRNAKNLRYVGRR